jgi:hypothetical protein
MNNAVRDLRQAAPEVMTTLFRYGPRGPWWRSARRQDQRAGGASNCRRHALLALHPPYHAEGAVKQGASRAAVAETLAMAVYMGAGPSVMYAAQALEAVDQITAKAG